MATNNSTTIVGAGPTKAAAKSGSQTQPQPKLASAPIRAAILDDLASRFIINVPVQERNNMIRICFQMELAHWFYLDFYTCQGFPKCGIKQFAFQMFQHIPFLSKHLDQVEKILEDWKSYKLTVPTYGAILISEDLKNCLLVQSFYSKSSWGFPKGKINEGEDPMHCAIREVKEETGFNATNLIVPTDFLELTINDQYTRLYLVCGVPQDTVFVPQTRNEIRCCEWFPIDQLPVNKNGNMVKDNLSMNGNSFIMILPVVKRLKKWINKKREQQQDDVFEGKTGPNQSGSANRQQRQRHKSMGDLDQQQRTKSSGSQQYFPNNQPQILQQQPKNTPNENYQEFTAGMGDPNVSTSNKKPNLQKQLSQTTNNSSGAAGLNVSVGRSQTKRKLFDTVTTKEDRLAIFNENKTWLGFKLDYSKFFQ
ncbi:m7GpppN-mRNA hydrolase [Uranotaenia lowii]|uniref:m7GpppN-mRNA hydrolase n=1 Tax=Uranotaenia lowii TaxID=190385 RepID=UPI002478D58E|nr:m7GpppN-mRNA hydrolase [Uranotaenia lowii]